MCHSYYTVLYIGTIIRMECVTSIIMCNTSELLYLWNVSPLLYCAIHQNYHTYAMCHFYYSVQYISYALILLMQYVTCM